MKKFLLVVIIMNTCFANIRNLPSPSIEDFWAHEATNIDWIENYEKVFHLKENENPFNSKWFTNGKLNVFDQCVSRWNNKYPNETALIWIKETSKNEKLKEITYSYSDLNEIINKTANVLLNQGVKKHDVVSIWMPMIPEAIFFQLACAKIGAIHNVIFAGFSHEKVKERLIESKSEYLILVDGYTRKGKQFIVIDQLKNDSAFFNSLKKIIVVDNLSCSQPPFDNCISWNDNILEASSECKSEVMDSNDPLFVLFTSGTTAKPKGIIHSSAGYITYVLSTLKHAWNLKGLLTNTSPKERDVWFCTADIGWITGHSYLTYGPLAYGVPIVMYEGNLIYPHKDIAWEIIQKYKVTHFYTSPTLIRMLDSLSSNPSNYDLTSLKVLGSVGEPINSEAWHWLSQIAKNKCPIIDTYWQTETGGHILCPFSSDEVFKPGSCSFPFYGINPVLLNNNKEIITKPFEKGFLCFKDPWPGIMQSIINDPLSRYNKYFSEFDNYYYSGDEAYFDDEGFYWIIGRADDIINISGHRFGTAEIENILCLHPKVKEAAIVSVKEKIKGEKIIAYVVIDYDEINDITNELKQLVAEKLCAIVKPSEVIVVKELPKTRSGKILRRILRSYYLREPLGDTSTIENLSSIQHLINQ